MSEVTLKKWRIRQYRNGVPYLIANTVHNHPIIGTGYYGHSTAIVWIELERGLAATLNTLYRLEEPHPDVSSSEQQALLEKLHPDHVPHEIRRAHGARRPWPEDPEPEDDLVAIWVIDRWSKPEPGTDT